MAFAISIKSMGDKGQPIRRQWTTFEKFETTPSMSAMDYPPHVTLAIYDGVSEAQLRDAMRRVFRPIAPIQLTFSKLAVFTEPRFVVWADPAPSAVLRACHAALHAAIDPALCREHYQPSVWWPHCTLAMNVPPVNQVPVMTMVNAPMQPFDVVFDVADCIAFPPMTVIEEHALGEVA